MNNLWENLSDKDYTEVRMHERSDIITKKEVDVTLQTKRSDQTEAKAFDLQGAFYIHPPHIFDFDHV